jgi:hypothetical protein
MTSPINKAVASGNGNRLFTEKQHVQIAIASGNGNRLFMEKQHVQIANNPR